mgnify:CR=1 FL=1
MNAAPKTEIAFRGIVFFSILLEICHFYCINIAYSPSILSII